MVIFDSAFAQSNVGAADLNVRMVDRSVSYLLSRLPEMMFATSKFIYALIRSQDEK